MNKTVRMWLARDKGGEYFLSHKKPLYDGQIWESISYSGGVVLGKRAFNSLLNPGECKRIFITINAA